MDYDIFENAKDKAEAKSVLPTLTDHPGWKFIIRALDANIAFLGRELREHKEFKNLEEVYALQDRIDDFENFKSLPSTIVQSLQDQPEPEDDSDPFE